MSDDYPNVFSPIRLGSVEIANRLYFGPHGNPLEVGGGPTEDFIHYYAERAKAGVGLLFHSLPVSHRAGLHRACPSRDDAVPAFTAVAEQMHECGAKIFAQLNYFFDFPTQWGPLSPFAPNFSPSGIQRHAHYGVTRQMTQADIDGLHAAFRRAATNLSTAGYDGIELHATHGMITEMFLSPYFNKRTDRYGGDLDGRMLFLTELLQEVRAGAGPDMAVGVRLQCDEMLPGGLTSDDCREILARLVELGLIDFADLDVSVEPEQSYMSLPTYHLPQFFYQPYVEAVRSGAGPIPVLSTLGRVTAVAEAERFLADRTVDMVGVVRGLIAEPQLLANARDGRESESRRCIGANMCQDRRMTGNFGCAINPASAHERLWGIETLRPGMADPSRVVVVGGGPAGLEAARVAARLGHNVVLFEADSRLGGQLNPWSTLPRRELVADTVAWYERQLAELDVVVRLGTPADTGLVLAEHPDAVLVATGSRYVATGESGYVPHPIPGHDRPFVLAPEQIFAGTVPSGRVVLLDDEALNTGSGLAEFLVDSGCNVTVVTRWGAAAHGLEGALENRNIVPILKKIGVEILTKSYLRTIDDGAVVVYDIDSGEDRTLDGVDSVVLVTMRRQHDLLSAQLEPIVNQVFAVGDALAPRGLPEATYEGHRFARLVGVAGAPRTFTEAYWQPVDAGEMPRPPRPIQPSLRPVSAPSAGARAR